MSKVVLIVDDSASVRQIVSMVLKASGYTVIEADNGKNALDKLDGQKIHLIVSDVNMPEMDGMTFVKHARELDAYKFTPVLMLTTETDQKMRDTAKQMGVRAWLVKPFQPPLLLSTLAKLM
ncbi:response regulator [Alteromonas sp. KUL156]|nr:response regulator [Alteromonas sp. KUL154]GFE02849.1 response regulator [Alteromonas sp. KUL156]